MTVTRWRRDESGMTLTELLVVIGILAVVGGIVTAGMVSGLQTTRRGQDRAESLIELERALQRTTREIRAAAPVVLALGAVHSEIGAEVVRDAELHVFTFRLDGGDFVYDRTVYDVTDVDRTSPLGSSFSGRVLVSDVNELRFDYYDSTFEDSVTFTGDYGAVTAGADGQDDPILCNPASLTGTDRTECIASLRNATSVGIHIERAVRDQTPQSVQTRVSLRN